MRLEVIKYTVIIPVFYLRNRKLLENKYKICFAKSVQSHCWTHSDWKYTVLSLRVAIIRGRMLMCSSLRQQIHIFHQLSTPFQGIITSTQLFYLVQITTYEKPLKLTYLPSILIMISFVMQLRSISDTFAYYHWHLANCQTTVSPSSTKSFLIVICIWHFSTGTCGTFSTTVKMVLIRARRKGDRNKTLLDPYWIHYLDTYFTY
jgi:hypothetical protein